MAVDDIVSHANDGQVDISDDGGNSATLSRFQGDLKLSGIGGRGSEIAESEAQGALIGLRRGKRKYPQITFSRIAAKRGDTFMKTLLGLLGGSVSTTDDIGDVHTNDLDYQDPYGASARSIQADDVYCEDVEFSQGDPSSVESITLKVYGRLVVDGEVIVSGRDPLA
jgi:hypothetical protein